MSQLLVNKNSLMGRQDIKKTWGPERKIIIIKGALGGGKVGNHCCVQSNNRMINGQ